MYLRTAPCVFLLHNPTKTFNQKFNFVKEGPFLFWVFKIHAAPKTVFIFRG